MGAGNFSNIFLKNVQLINQIKYDQLDEGIWCELSNSLNCINDNFYFLKFYDQPGYYDDYQIGIYYDNSIGEYFWYTNQTEEDLKSFELKVKHDFNIVKNIVLNNFNDLNENEINLNVKPMIIESAWLPPIELKGDKLKNKLYNDLENLAHSIFDDANYTKCSKKFMKEYFSDLLTNTKELDYEPERER